MLKVWACMQNVNRRSSVQSSLQALFFFVVPVFILGFLVFVIQAYEQCLFLTYARTWSDMMGVV